MIAGKTASPAARSVKKPLYSTNNPSIRGSPVSCRRYSIRNGLRRLRGERTTTAAPIGAPPCFATMSEPLGAAARPHAPIQCQLMKNELSAFASSPRQTCSSSAAEAAERTLVSTPRAVIVPSCSSRELEYQVVKGEPYELVHCIVAV